MTSKQYETADFGSFDDFETSCPKCEGPVQVIHGVQQPHDCPGVKQG